MIGDRERAARVLLDEQHGEALVVDETLEQLEDLRHDPRGQPERRLVQEEQRGSCHQGAADDEHLPLASGQRRGRHVAALVERREEAVDPGEVVGLHPAPGQATEAQVLLDGELGDDAAALRHVGHPQGGHLLGGDSRDRRAVQGDAATRRAVQAGDGAQQRGLAGAVGAEDGGDAALLGSEGDTTQGGDRAVARGQLGDGQHQDVSSELSPR